MAVPKRKWSRSRTRSRQSHKALEIKPFTYCPESGLPVAPHTVCAKSGYYKGVKVFVTKFERSEMRAEKSKNRASAIQPDGAAPITESQLAVAKKQAAKVKRTVKKAENL